MWSRVPSLDDRVGRFYHSHGAAAPVAGSFLESRPISQDASCSCSTQHRTLQIHLTRGLRNHGLQPRRAASQALLVPSPLR